MSSIDDKETSELNELKAIRDKLSEDNRKLSAQNIELHSKLLTINRLETHNNHLLGIIKEKDNRIQTLTEEKNKLIQSKKEELKDLDTKYSKELYYLKNQVENNTQKIDKILKVAQDSLGIDLKSIIAGYAVGKLGNNQKDNKEE